MIENHRAVTTNLYTYYIDKYTTAAVNNQTYGVLQFIINI